MPPKVRRIESARLGEKMVTESAEAQTVEDLPEWFNAAADLIEPNLRAGRGEKAAFIDVSGVTTYNELSESVDRMTGVLWSLGIRRDQRVLLCLLDTAQFPIVFLGAIRAGVVPIPLNTLLTTGDYEWILENSGACAVFVSGELTDQWRDIAKHRPEVRFVSCRDGPWQRFDQLMAEVLPSSPAKTHRDDVAFMLYTSGSTGRPRAAIHTQSSMRLTANLFGVGVLGYHEHDIVLSVAKLFFAYGLGNALAFPLAAGATAVLHKDRATPTAITDLMVRHGVSIFNSVPTFFAAWFAAGIAPSRTQIPELRLATSAGECLPAQISEEFRSRYGVDIIDGLGSTEMLHVYLSQRPGEVRYGCTGLPVPGYELRIVDDGGRPAAPDELGELHVKGPTAAIGYWRNRGKSISTFRGEWMRTGDKCRCSKDGWYTYGGRADDMLKVGGIYVSPVELEEALLTYQGVLEAAVVGVPDEAGLVKPRAHIVLRPGYEPNRDLEDELKAHIKKHLAPYKYLRWIVFTDELPKTATGKIQRFKLRERT